MRIALGADHAGFVLKAAAVEAIEAAGHEVVDHGTFGAEAVDYPDYAERVCDALLRGEAERGVMLCGSGIGMAVAANKFPGIRAGLCHDVYSAHQGVEHEDMNVLALGARVIGAALAQEIIRAFLAAAFIGEGRHLRRFRKLQAIEERFLRPYTHQEVRGP